MPLDLKRAVVYVEPVDANRFRVMCGVPFAVPAWVYALCSLAATLGLVFLRAEGVGIALGLLLGCVGTKTLSGRLGTWRI